MRLMKRTLALGAAVMAMGLVVSVPVQADVTLYNQPTDFNGALASQNDTTGGNGNFATVYDNFTLGASSTIDGVTWVGSYFNPPTPGTITSFDVSFYSDSSGTPGALLGVTTISGNASETSLGIDNAGDPVFAYSAAVTPFSALAGTQYWLSIVPSLGFPPQWGWETGTGGDGASYQVFFGSGATTGVDQAFTLIGNVGAVPEPSTLVMLSIGSVTLFGYGWRRRNSARIAGQP
jgi:PEP-CTERM motif